MLLPELHFRQYSDEVISHQHDGQWQVVFALSGEMEINMHRQHFRLNAGNGVVIPPSVSHAFSGQTGNQNYVLEMPATAQWALNEKMGHFSLTPAAIGLLNWLKNFPQAPEQNFTVTRLLLAQLKPENRWLDSLTQWLELRLHLPISCEDIATAFCISVSTLQRKIKSETQLTAMQFLLQKRMEAAGSLLLTNSTVEQIALSVGYDSHSAFSQAFRKFYGKTPIEYRS
ncbi:MULTISPECIES: helix-turn-helix domain-containing protein [Providencia]|uniref:AraC family transcriptional regulator n=1 Tax=Providencia heimbachae ATCC 35613 TaxID=1354272 RepID=A0A1B7JWA3_9GAMM|nr:MULTISPECIES: AraC family transcriptional regulator [Providencia]MBP6123799.1 helix-turn-helix domain-containing protein [Providencia sp.]NIH24035.1 AraC family transcriptional regulator [Providencia heimbachae]OAT52178.1 AraC family transcriptional regulator [Providencia heimbachae ATCC 35613]QCJ71435.1 AraC family transcriptional regulator [Providencia heimbachae]SQH14947.1 HTH-type transcriptional regulator AdiY [Providencia heimbachae]